MIEAVMKQGKSRKINKGVLGRDLIISKDSIVFINSANYSIEYFEETIEIIIGIGKDCTASLIMSIEAWKALNNGEKVHIK